MPMLIAWFSWRARNASKYQNKKMSAFCIITRVLKHLKTMHCAFKINKKVWKGDLSLAEFFGLTVHVPPPKPLILVYWKRPPLNWVKVNTDGSFCTTSLCSVVGGLIRCANGRVLNCFQNYLGKHSIFFVELKAILLGISLCKTMGFRKIVVEYDAANAISALTNKSSKRHWTVCQLIQSVQVCCEGLEVVFQHIHREGNAVADLLAKEALKLKLQRQCMLAVCSATIKQQGYSDNTGVPYLRVLND